MKAEWSFPGGSDPKTDESLRHSLKDAAAFATMVGIGETYLSAFALFLKACTTNDECCSRRCHHSSLHSFSYFPPGSATLPANVK